MIRTVSVETSVTTTLLTDVTVVTEVVSARTDEVAVTARVVVVDVCGMLRHEQALETSLLRNPPRNGGRPPALSSSSASSASDASRLILGGG
jgi:hypothetical protein